MDAGKVARKVQPLLSRLASVYKTAMTWQVTVNFPRNTLTVNIPPTSESDKYQLVMNTLTNAWCEFQGIVANNWAGDYFGGDGFVGKAYSGTRDNVTWDGLGGIPIVADTQQAFSYFNDNANNKHFKLIQPTFLVQSPISYYIFGNMDFSFETGSIPSSTTAPLAGGIWDGSNWDGTTWGGLLNSQKEWSSLIGYGMAASVRLAFSSTQEVTWVATKWVYETGGII